jgi:hypothetical protein
LGSSIYPPVGTRVFGEKTVKEKSMKKLLLLLAVVLAFSFTAVAQYGSSSGTSQTEQTTTSKSKKASSGEMGEMSHSQGEMGKTAKSAKEHTMTGCISKEPNADGMYVFTNGHYKKGVEVGPTEMIKEHAGHTMKLTGHWTSAAGAGEMGAMSKGEKGEKHFEITSLKHLSTTCTAGMGKSKKGMSKTNEMK